jgi:hypothetical protein
MKALFCQACAAARGDPEQNPAADPNCPFILQDTSSLAAPGELMISI